VTTARRDVDPLEALVLRTKQGDRRAAEQLLGAVQHELFRLSLRMLGTRPEAEDATQEILLQALTHLSEFRGESAFRTWLWRIAVRHLLGAKKSRREQLASFETLDQLVEQGEKHPALPDVPHAELSLMAQEVRIACTHGVLLSLDRDQRIAWLLAEVFQLSSDEAASVLEVDAATYRKRLSRARDKLEGWMRTRCGLADGRNPCRCTRQIPVAAAMGVVDPHRLEYANRASALRVVAEADAIETAASLLKPHPAKHAPPAVLAGIRALIDSGRYRVFDA
jgi:RNA polymerase sigma factor (sigma-70 family)